MRTYALVTGASSGIGYAFVRELASRGHGIIAVSNDEAASAISFHDGSKRMFSCPFLRIDDFFDNLSLFFSEVSWIASK